MTEEEEQLMRHQAEAWNRLVAELIVEFGLPTTEPGENAFEQVQSFVRRQLNSLSFYKLRCENLQKIQNKMRDPERKMVCDILANGYTMQNSSLEQFGQPYDAGGL